MPRWNSVSKWVIEDVSLTQAQHGAAFQLRLESGTQLSAGSLWLGEFRPPSITNYYTARYTAFLRLMDRSCYWTGAGDRPLLRCLWRRGTSA